MSAEFGIWLGAILTCAIFSYLLGDNELFKLAEHIFVGAGAGHAITMGFGNIRDSAWNPMVKEGKFLMLVPIILGVLLYARFIKGYGWLTRWGVAVMVGIGTGVLLRGLPSSQIIQQIRATMLPLNSLDNFIIVLGTLGGITFFLFTIKANAPVNAVSTFGRWAMMVCFGAAFGAAVFQRTGQAAGAIQTVLKVFGR
jgi:hypothetical protein